MVSVRTSNEEGAAEDIVGSNPTSDAKTKTNREWNNIEKTIEMYGGKIYGTAVSEL